ncbi:4'-phosphopantetheinyl transferase family protein [Streptomyces oceani]|uniref:4'-phosphopantetheinyl transferase n=1 Tax=Streptomyces oceani TaxID=1075402 RepID=A0A1E7KFH1_9ACTN|nr:4'-phosphopantetheinyl transferase superfamily protein [Streptomyces oceani]OEV02677.1 4'-phosphopantetheinyl transferase [Streptomyces oceani]
MIEEIVRHDTLFEEVFADPPGDPVKGLFHEEAELVAKAVEKRQREFSTVRACARAALARLGRAPAPLLPNKRGAPQWPAGVVGSMTHCDGYRAAVVADAAGMLGLGIDAEPNQPLPDGVLEMISLPEERVWIAEMASRRPEVHWGRLLFSAKESVFKTWYPLVGKELDFTEAEIRLDEAERSFHARFLVPAPTLGGVRTPALTGRWTVRDGLLSTAICLPRTASGAAS